MHSMKRRKKKMSRELTIDVSKSKDIKLGKPLSFSCLKRAALPR